MSKDKAQDIKARYWQALMYPENMLPDWQDVICEKLQVPFVYCVHDKCFDKENDERKVHVHIIVAFRNTTTYNHALNVFKSLEAEGKCAIPNDIIQNVIEIRRAYNYLIHDTEDARRKKKHLYAPENRVTGNGFDIGNYEQLSLSETEDIINEITDLIFTERIVNFADLFLLVKGNYDQEHIRILRTHSSFFEKLTRGMYQKSAPTSADE